MSTIGLQNPAGSEPTASRRDTVCISMWYPSIGHEATNVQLPYTYATCVIYVRSQFRIKVLVITYSSVLVDKYYLFSDSSQMRCLCCYSVSLTKTTLEHPFVVNL